jgi:uncharacterized protein YuzE
MAEKTLVDYDENNDDLFLKRGSDKYEASMEIGDFIVDFSKNDKIVGIEIINASKNFGVAKALLKSVKSASLAVTQRNQAMMVTAILVLENDQEIRTAIPIAIKN